MWRNVIIAAIVLVNVASTPATYVYEVDTKHRFPITVTSTEGVNIDITRLVQTQTVIVVTLKATWCPVCQEQLLRLQRILPRINRWKVTFLVLSPGPPQELEEIRKRTQFPYPFIEDVGLRIAHQLGLRMGTQMIRPSMFILDRDRRIKWLQSGRSSFYYGDEELLEKIGIVLETHLVP